VFRLPRQYGMRRAPGNENPVIHRALFLLSGALLTFGVACLVALQPPGIPLVLAGAVLLRLVQRIPEVHPPIPCWVDTRGLKP